MLLGITVVTSGIEVVLGIIVRNRKRILCSVKKSSGNKIIQEPK